MVWRNYVTVTLCISRKRCKISGKLVLITNNKSYMSFRFVPKSVTLNDLERRNGVIFALFQRIRVASARTAWKFTFPISSPDEFLYVSLDTIMGDFENNFPRPTVMQENFILLFRQLRYAVGLSGKPNKKARLTGQRAANFRWDLEAT